MTDFLIVSLSHNKCQIIRPFLRCNQFVSGGIASNDIILSWFSNRSTVAKYHIFLIWTLKTNVSSKFQVLQLCILALALISSSRQILETIQSHSSQFWVSSDGITMHVGNIPVVCRCPDFKRKILEAFFFFFSIYSFCNDASNKLHRTEIKPSIFIQYVTPCLTPQESLCSDTLLGTFTYL